MRNFLIGVLLFLLVPNLYVDLVVYTAFKVQQEYIVKNKCLQKDDIVNTCKGSCVLSDQLKEVNKKQEDPKYPNTQKTKLFPDFIPLNNTSSTFLFTNNSENILCKASISPREKWCDIFRPPKV